MRAKQRLVLTSATRQLTTFRPDDGYVHQPETGLVIASSPLVAHDMTSLAWLLEGRAPRRRRGATAPSTTRTSRRCS